MKHLLRPYCRPILPLVYDESLSYYEFLCKILHKLNEVITVTDDMVPEIERITKEWLEENFGDEIIPMISENKTLVTPLMYQAGGDTDDAMLQKFFAALNSNADLRGVIPGGELEYNGTYFSDEKRLIGNLATNTGTGKIITSTALQQSFGRDTVYDIDLYSIQPNYTVQGACYNSIKNTWDFVLASPNSTTYIAEFSADFKTVLQKKALPIYHGNALTFNAKTGKLYSIGGLDDSTGAIFEINADDLTFSRSITKVMPGVYKHGIAYDAANDIYMVMAEYDLVMCDADFNVLRTYTDAFKAITQGWSDIIFDGEAPLLQAMSIAPGGNVLLLINIRRASAPQSFLFASITQFSYADGSIKRTWRIPSYNTNAEAETLIQRGNEIYMSEIVDVRSVEFEHVYISKIADLRLYTPENTAVFDMSRPGPFIPEGADLNDYTIPGVYYSPNHARSITLENVPGVYWQSGFTLYVYRIGDFDLLQEIHFRTSAPDQNGYKCTRQFYTSANAWQPWNFALYADNFIVQRILSDQWTFPRSGNRHYTFYGAGFITDAGSLMIPMNNVLADRTAPAVIPTLSNLNLTVCTDEDGVMANPTYTAAEVTLQTCGIVVTLRGLPSDIRQKVCGFFGDLYLDFGDGEKYPPQS